MFDQWVEDRSDGLVSERVDVDAPLLLRQVRVPKVDEEHDAVGVAAVDDLGDGEGVDGSRASVQG